MDSTLTLVNPSPPTVLHFDSKSVIKTTVSYPDGRLAYNISHKTGTTALRIQVARGDEVVIVIEENEVFSDTVTIRGTKMKIKKWLKEQRVGDIHTRLIDTQYGRFLSAPQFGRGRYRACTVAAHGRTNFVWSDQELPRMSKVFLVAATVRTVDPARATVARYSRQRSRSSAR
ncbi:hypothetical protein CPB85DRAFT_1254466 [Mucidula mucida]|nr:hypothetical protein CPB85DRAFT_1254466 [Mucidula mucida]